MARSRKTVRKADVDARVKAQTEEQTHKERIESLKLHLREQTDVDYAKTVTEKRVEFLMDMMVNGAWVTGSTHQQLSKAWGISTTRIDGLAAEARRNIARWVREDKEHVAEVRSLIILGIERITRKAELRGSQAGYRDALEGLKLQAQLHGLIKQKVELEEVSQFDGWTREELEHFADTGEMPARLRGGNGHDPDAARTH